MTTPTDYSEKIPNNVDLHEDRRLQRALESWQPNFINWWSSMGPALPTQDVYLRTAINVGREGWAHFGHVPMRDYRWGIFLAERDTDRRIAFGAHKGEPAWQKIPGEYRASLQRLIVIQGDTEPASVEQQRNLGATAPSLYDLRNLFQVNVEEGRHLWAMVYLLHAYFGRDGRDEADALLLRNSGSEDSPRILGAFNEETPDWLSFFMFTYFTDRDGKYQLGTLKESAFDPLSRTCEFMLKEEAHHMFVGTTGVDRIVERTAQLMVEHDTDDVAAYGGDPAAGDPEIPELPLQRLARPVRQRDLDQRRQLLHGRAEGPLERRTPHRRPSADQRLGPGRRGRRRRDRRHRGRVRSVGLNLDLRREYIDDCQHGVDRWNRALASAGLTQRLLLPHVAFNRKVGAFKGIEASPDRRSAAARGVGTRRCTAGCRPTWTRRTCAR